MRTFALQDILASRTLRFGPGHGPAIDITVTIGRPMVDPQHADRAWMCLYQITGIGDERVRAIFGIDAMQALVLALHVLPAELRAIARDEAGSFPDANEDLGLTHACRLHLGEGAWPST